jgi:hypothetical protein
MSDEEKKPISDAENKEEEVKKEEAAQEEKELDAVDSMEKETFYELATLKEEGNQANDDAVKDAEDQLKKIFDDCRSWIKANADPEAVKEQLQKAADDAGKVLNATKEKVIEVSQSEQFKKTVEAGKDFIVGTGTMIADGLKYGADTLMKNPTVKKVVDKADEKLDALRDNKNLQEAVDKTEEAVDKLNAAIFQGIKKFFHNGDEEKEKTDEQ